jgi:hypothetical protein
MIYRLVKEAKSMKYLTKALLACGLLVHTASVFLPWSTRCIVGGAGITYWSFKARIYPYPYPDFLPPFEKGFLTIGLGLVIGL